MVQNDALRVLPSSNGHGPRLALIFSSLLAFLIIHHYTRDTIEENNANGVSIWWLCRQNAFIVDAHRFMSLVLSRCSNFDGWVIANPF
jgi:hypothetical protein